MPTPALARGVAASGALVARTQVAQRRERVVARVVPVTPRRRDGVIADEHDVHEARLLSRQGRRGIEPARQPGLAAAEGTRAQPAEALETIRRLVAVAPPDLELARLAIGVDAERNEGIGRAGERHGPNSRRGTGHPRRADRPAPAPAPGADHCGVLSAPP